MKTNLHKFFGRIPDPRINRKRKNLLIDIIILPVMAVISGADSWYSIEMFGKLKQGQDSRQRCPIAEAREKTKIA